MSTLPHHCRYVNCEDEQVEGALCITHRTLLDRAKGDLDAEKAEVDQ